jgi:hypothetical protein
MSFEFFLNLQGERNQVNDIIDCSKNIFSLDLLEVKIQEGLFLI